MQISEFNVWSFGKFEPAPTQLNVDRRHQRLSYLSTQSELEVAYSFAHWLRGLLGRPVEPDVRGPYHKYSLAYAPAGDTLWTWHHDMESPGLQNYVLAWSNGIGTEIRDLDTGEYFQAEPFHVIGFSNAACEHRAPHVRLKDRWFLRGLLPNDFNLPDKPNIRPATPTTRTQQLAARARAKLEEVIT